MIQPLDALTLAMVVAVFTRPPARLWLVATVPVIGYAVRLAPIGDFQVPVLALVACLVSARLSPAALLLAAPVYEDPAQAILVSLLWATSVVLFGTLEERLDSADIPPRLRGIPIKLVAAGVIYHILYPLSFL